jgi:hypothetical protein
MPLENVLNANPITISQWIIVVYKENIILEDHVLIPPQLQDVLNIKVLMSLSVPNVK